MGGGSFTSTVDFQTGAVLEKTFKSGEKLEKAEIEQVSMQYIYPDGDNYVFMDANSGDQQIVPGDKMEDEAKFLADGANVEVTLLKGVPIGIRKSKA